MTTQYDPTECQRLLQMIAEQDLQYTRGPSRYDPRHVFDVAITGVSPATPGRAVLEVERFVGGGFAGQVYRVLAREIAFDGPPVDGLEAGRHYAVKIIIPPSTFAPLFRNATYWLAYQGPFAAQVNPAAARTGVLWQKLIRRAAAIRFDDPACVCDTYATFYDDGLGSYGEINEWVDGRPWRFEVDDRIFQRKLAEVDALDCSPEYRAKRRFMREFVALLHEMGAPELARQYEWWTCKSQPNVLKRAGAGEGPAEGLTALDFRAGLALLPFMPMSPGDIALILKGAFSGRFVQFDRGDLGRLEEFVDAHGEDFDDLRPALNELKEVDPAYRASLPDISHHGLRLVYDRTLHKSVKDGLIQGWKARRLVDEEHADRLRGSFFGFWLFWLVGMAPLLGKFARKLWGVPPFRRHVGALFTSPSYLMRALRASRFRVLLEWYRDGRVDKDHLEKYLNRPGLHLFVRIVPGALPLPPLWHRFLTDWKYAKTSVWNAVAYPIRFYRDADFRMEWLRHEVEEGAREGMLTEEEKEQILGRIHDPFIQKYLKCVAVHLCTLPVTQVVAVIVAAYYCIRFGESWQQSMLTAAGILAVFQGLPISPGSLTRGSYVVYLMIKERNVRNYWLAALVSFWHYIGYLGFPLQMVKEFPALSRFMAGRWATKFVRIIPVFGERGALIEHWIFDLFFNVPLSLKRRFTRVSAKTEPEI